MTAVSEVTETSTAPSLEEQAAAFARDNPEAAAAVGLDVTPAAPVAEPEEDVQETPSGPSEPQDAAPSEATSEEDPQENTAETEGEGRLDLQALSQKWAETGSLDDADYAALEAVGISKDDVATFVRGQEAANAEFANAVYGATGGQDQYSAMIAWAGENLTQEEIDVFDTVISSNDVAAAQMAATGLMARYRASEGFAPSRVVTGQPSTANVPYSSQADMMADLQKPEYQTDPAFRERVLKRMQASGSNIL